MLSGTPTPESNVNFWLQLPVLIQVAAVAVLGAIVGGQINRGIYRLAWDARAIGPWSLPPPDAPSRSLFDRLPIVGWIALRRESTIHGTGYWLRPLLIELVFSAGIAWLYFSIVHFQIDELLRQGVVASPADAVGHFLRLAVLIGLMTVATFIDFDEKTIPDEITVPGTMIALFLSVFLPRSALPIVVQGRIEPLLLTSPTRWPVELDGPAGLVFGLICVAFWSLALIPKTWTTRRGWVRAIRYAWASSFRTDLWWKYSLLAVVLSLLTCGVWAWGGAAWQGLLSALVGMLFGGGMVWCIRFVAGGVLNKEAMGFGDVTLLAMIGAYLGWQTSLIVFFLAPFAALIVSLAQWAVTRRRDIAFGPYLSLAAVVVAITWSAVWSRAGNAFLLGGGIPLILGFCLIAMALMLYSWRRLEDAWYRWRGE